MPTQWDQLSVGSAFPEVYDYTVYKVGSTYNARNNVTGGVTSNTSFSSLMSTLNTNLVSGGTIFISTGTFNVDSPINISNNISIIGDGRKNTILLRTTSARGNTVLMRGSNVTIARMTFDGNYATNKSNLFAELTCIGTNTLITDIEAVNFNTIGIDSGGPTQIISNCFVNGVSISGASTFGIWCAGSGIQTISKCMITNCSYNAIFAQGKTTIEDSYFSGNAFPAGGQISAGGSAVITTVRNCVIDPGAVSDSGIEVANGEWIVTGNRITGQHSAGITTDPSPVALGSFVITNNLVKNCAQTVSGVAGILIQGPNTNFLIANNICYDDQGSPTQNYGIAIKDQGGNPVAANHFVVKDNICFGNVTSQIIDKSTGTDKRVIDNIGFVASDVEMSGRTTFLSASGFGLNFQSFVSGNTGNFVAANSGVFGPVGYFYVQASGGTTYKVPLMNS